MIHSFPFRFHKMEIPYDAFNLPGYLFLPRETKNPACVIMINGLDSAKEIELFTFAKSFLQRGLAVLIFDGPGQGVLLNKAPLAINFENVIAACLTTLKNISLIDHQRIGLFGVSFGGYLALRSASLLSDKINARIDNLSGGFDIANFSQMSSRIQQDFTYVFQQQSKEDMQNLTEHISLANLPAPTCPVLCIHGGFDTIFTKRIMRVMNWCNDKLN